MNLTTIYIWMIARNGWYNHQVRNKKKKKKKKKDHTGCTWDMQVRINL